MAIRWPLRQLTRKLQPLQDKYSKLQSPLPPISPMKPQPTPLKSKLSMLLMLAVPSKSHHPMRYKLFKEAFAQLKNNKLIAKYLIQASHSHSKTQQTQTQHCHSPTHPLSTLPAPSPPLPSILIPMILMEI